MKRKNCGTRHKNTLQSPLEKKVSHNENFKRNHIDTIIDTEHYPNVNLLNFQEDIVKKMVDYDTKFFKLTITDDKEESSQSSDYCVKASSGLLDVGVGLGKTFMVCERVRQYFNHGYDDIVNKYFFRCNRFGILDNNLFHKTKNGSRIMIIVPVEIFSQWIEQMVYFFGNDYVSNNVLNTNQNFLDDKHADFNVCVLPTILDKKIILLKHNQIYTINNWKAETWKKIDIEYVFIDEYHLLNEAYCDLKIDHCSFVWHISASMKDERKTVVVSGTHIINNLLSKGLKSVTTSFEFKLPTLIVEKVYYIKPALFNSVIPNEKDLHNTLLLSESPLPIILKRLNDLKMEYCSHDLVNIVARIADDKYCERNEMLRIFELVPIDDMCQIKIIEKNRPHQMFITDLIKCCKNPIHKFENESIVECCLNVEGLCANILKQYHIKYNILTVHDIIRSCAIIKNITVKSIITKIEADHLPKLHAIYNKHENIVANLERDWCMVCFEQKDKILLVCCDQVICRYCIIRIASFSSKCPHCRSDIIHTINSPLNIKEQDQESNQLKSYYLTCDLIFFECRKKFKKTLIVFNANSFCVRLYDTIKNEYHNLSGSSIMIHKTVNKFKQDSKPFMFLNSKICNVGLNLQFVECIVFLNTFEKREQEQMIGRAHRFPRTNELFIIFLKQKN